MPSTACGGCLVSLIPRDGNRPALDVFPALLVGIRDQHLATRHHDQPVRVPIPVQPDEVRLAPVTEADPKVVQPDVLLLHERDQGVLAESEDLAEGTAPLPTDPRADVALQQFQASALI